MKNFNTDIEFTLGGKTIIYKGVSILLVKLADSSGVDLLQQLGTRITSLEILKQYIPVTTDIISKLSQEKEHFIIPNDQVISAFTSENIVEGIVKLRRIFITQNNIAAIETNDIILKLKSGYNYIQVESILKAKGLEKVLKVGFSPETYQMAIKNNADPFAICNELNETNWCDFAEPDFRFLIKRRFVPTDSLYNARFWHLDNKGVNSNGIVKGKIAADINAEVAWGSEPNGGQNVKIAIIESGFDLTHPDIKFSLNNNNSGGAVNFNNSPPERGSNKITSTLISLETGLSVLFSHGTATAAMAVATSNIDHSVTPSGLGVAFRSEFIPVQVDLDKQRNIVFARAIAYAADPSTEAVFLNSNPSDGADILSMSFSLGNSSIINMAVQFAITHGRKGKGLIIINSASNEFLSLENDPFAAKKEIISVGSTGADDRYQGSGYSTNDKLLTLVAPGADIFTANDSIFPGITTPRINGNVPSNWLDPNVPEGYISNIRGTSFAGPIVAGVIALLLKSNPNLTSREVKELIKKSTTKVDPGYFGKLPPQIDGGRNLGWRISLTGTDYIVDSNGELVTNGPSAASAALQSDIIPIAGNLNTPPSRTFTFNVSNASGFIIGNTVLLSEDDTLTESPDVINNKIKVNNNNKFLAGQYIKIGISIGNYVGYDTTRINTSSNKIIICDPSGFLIGDKVIIGMGATREVLTINDIGITDGTDIKLNGYAFLQFNTSRVNPYGYGDPVTKYELVKISSIDSDGQTIHIDPSTPLLNGVNHSVGTKVSTSEVRTILNISGNQITTDHIEFAHKAGSTIKQGEAPVYSDAYGYGRIDAYLAVINALNYDYETSNPDLVVRDTLSDTGLSDTNATIDSPDVWVRNHNPNDDGNNAYPNGVNPPTQTSYNFAGPHEEPFADNDRWIYFRIKNIGAQPNYEANLKIYIAISDGTSAFEYPQSLMLSGDKLKWYIDSIDDSGSNDISKIKDGKPGIYLLQEITINEGDIAANGQFIGNVRWYKKNIPPANLNLKTHILLQISPFDGRKTENQVSKNNNITYKKINVLDRVKFKSNSNLLETSINFSQTGPPITKPFSIEINNDVAFDITKITIKIKRKNKSSTDNVVFKYSGTGWIFEDSTPSWIHFMNTPSAGNSATATFTGEFDIATEQKYIEFNVDVNDVAANVKFSGRHKIKVIIVDLPEENGVSSQSGTKIHFFTDIDLLQIQLPTVARDVAFGPFSDPAKPSKDFFRVTSLHGASADPQAYAVCDGLVCVQQDSSNSNLVNVILKPVQQPPLNFAPIRYIIYRGVIKDSLISSGIIASENNNRLNQSIWNSQRNRNESIKKRNAKSNLPPPSPLDPTPDISSIGYDLVSKPSDQNWPYNDDKPIDNLFFKGSDDFQLPLVRGGWDIGTFNKGFFGIDIIYDSLSYQPIIGKARVAENIIVADKLTGSETEKVKFENKNQREEVLNYMDPCAFFSSLYANRLYVRETPLKLSSTKDFTRKNEYKIYEDIIRNRFANKNRIYIDIRNEYGNSFNFYGNYGNNIQMSFEEGGVLVSKNYYENSWPLLIIENDSFLGSNSSKKNVIEISFSVTADTSLLKIENKLPLIYLSQGFISKSFPKDEKGAGRFIELNPHIESGLLLSQYTMERITLAVPNFNENKQTEVIASYIRLKYLKRFEQNPISPPESTGIVLRAANYYDHLFIPVNMQLPFGGTEKIKSVVFDEEAYIDATHIPDIQMDCITRIALAEDDNDNVTLFAYATEVRNKIKLPRRKSFSVTGESKNEEGDYLAQLPKKYDNLIFAKSDLTVGGNLIPLLNLIDTTEGSNDKFENVDPREFFTITLTKDQFNQIITHASNENTFSQIFPVYLGVKNKVYLIDDNGISYTKFDLVLRGYKLFTDEYQTVEQDTNPLITVYSNGNI